MAVGAVERLDQLANHPDYHESVYFELPHTVVSVSLKNKNADQRTYVSLAVERTVERTVRTGA